MCTKPGSQKFRFRANRQVERVLTERRLRNRLIFKAGCRPIVYGEEAEPDGMYSIQATVLAQITNDNPTVTVDK